MTSTKDVITELHSDKERVLKEQQRAIEQEIVERRLIAADTTLQVEDELREVNTEILNLEPPHMQAPDINRKERQVIEKEKRTLTKEEREEQRDTWSDVQQLKREEREIDRELLEQEQRQKRIQNLLHPDDPH